VNARRHNTPREGGPRLLYGSDFPVSHARGKCIALGDSFQWLNPHNADLTASYAEGGMVCCTLVLGVESLRALKVACDNMTTSAYRLRPSQIYSTGMRRGFLGYLRNAAQIQEVIGGDARMPACACGLHPVG
jgi:hypothetical protein